jgi:hypothetical protein
MDVIIDPNPRDSQNYDQDDKKTQDLKPQQIFGSTTDADALKNMNKYAWPDYSLGGLLPGSELPLD